MKFLFLFLCWSISLLTASAYAQTTTSDFCLATDEIIPYSPFSRFSADCNGIKMEETALFSRGLQEKFEKKLKANGFKILLKLDNQLLISKKSRKDLAVNELCVATKSYGMGRSFVACDSSPSIMLGSAKDAVIIQFAKSYNYKILQKPQDKNGFFILSR